MASKSKALARLALITLCIALLSGCAARRPELTRAEYLALVNRTYNGVKPEEALAAAEKLLRLADEDDTTFQHFESGFRAYRKWMLYLVISGSVGTDIWTVTAKAVEGGTKVTAYLQISGGNVFAPMATGVGGTSVVTLPGEAGTPINSTAMYDLFWARMDFLLGRQDRWMTCEEAIARVRKGVTYGFPEGMCGLTVDDRKPEKK